VDYPDRPGQLHAPRGSCRHGAPIGPGHRTHDGGRGGDGDPPACAFPGAAALLHPRAPGRGREGMIGRALAALAALVLLQAPAAAQDARVLDDFDDIAAWRADASDGVSAEISAAPGREGGALRLDFDFHDVSGYAFAARTLPIAFPANFEISFWIRADAPVNTLEVKFTDAAAGNVWWRNQPNFPFPGEWTRVVLRPRHIEFAWGPTEDRRLARTERIEIVVTRGTGGGAGSVFIDDLQIRELPADEGPLAPRSTVAS